MLQPTENRTANRRRSVSPPRRRAPCRRGRPASVRSAHGSVQHHRTRRPPVHRHDQPTGGDERPPPAGQRRAVGRVRRVRRRSRPVGRASSPAPATRAFSAGNDLKYQAAGGDRCGAADDRASAGITSRFDLNKPLIAAVNGVAMGGGFEIALACDIIVAAENAAFALPEVRVGLAALAGGVHRLPRTIGPKRALGHDPHRPPRAGPGGLRARLRQRGRARGRRRWPAPGAGRRRSWRSRRCRCGRPSRPCTWASSRAASPAPRAIRYSAVAEMVGVGGLHRGPAGVRREAPAELEGPLARALAGGVAAHPPQLSQLRH